MTIFHDISVLFRESIIELKLIVAKTHTATRLHPTQSLTYERERGSTLLSVLPTNVTIPPIHTRLGDYTHINTWRIKLNISDMADKHNYIRHVHFSRY